MTEPWIEKHLSEVEVHERRLQLESELDEQDRLSGDIAEFKRAIKNRTTDIERVTDRVRNLRTEIRERRTWVRAPEPQQHLGFERDETAENKPNGDVSRTGHDLFKERYPLALDAEMLLWMLRSVLAPEQQTAAVLAAVNGWHPDSGIFHGVAHWARIELAHADSQLRAEAGEPGIPGLLIPKREEMPEPLRELINNKPGKKKRARKS